MPQLAGMASESRSSRLRKGKVDMKKNLLFVFFALLFAPLYSQAQGLGSILGRVTDPAGAGVAGAQVTATQEGTGFTRVATTDTEGLYVLPSLRPAVYNLTVEGKGFSTSKQIGITLLAGSSSDRKYELEAGLGHGGRQRHV